MAYPNTVVLQLPVPDTAGVPTDYQDRLGNDQALSASHVVIDQFAAGMTGSACYTIWAIATGSATDFQGLGGLNNILGLEFNRSQDRVIQEVVAYHIASGSGGVTTVDVLVQQGATQPANFSTVFKSANNADKLALSSSAGNFGIARQAAFVSGSNMVWPKGTLLQAKILTTAGGTGLNAETGLTVQIFWKPSGSYGA